MPNPGSLQAENKPDMKKFLLSFLPFLVMALCVASFTSCSDDDDDAGGAGAADAAAAVAGEYNGSVSVTGYTGTIPTTVVLNKRTSTSVDMTFDSPSADLYYDFTAISVEEGENGIYTIRANDNVIFGTVSGRNLTLNLSSTSGSILFTGTRK